MNEGSKYQRAEKVRTEYVKMLSAKGIRFSPTTSRVIFRTETGKTIGIPCATERPSPKDGWFMGLPNERFDFIILLCQRDNDAPLDFVLPASFFSPLWKDSLYWEYLSSGWQVKFDVSRRSDDFVLKLKGRKRLPENIDRFLGHIEILG